MNLLEAMDLPEVSGWVWLQLAVGVLGYIAWTALRRRRPTKTGAAPTGPNEGIAQVIGPVRLTALVHSAGLKRYDELPGPVELPLLRSLHKVYMGPRPQINKLWTRMAREHGPLYKCVPRTKPYCKMRQQGKDKRTGKLPAQQLLLVEHQHRALELS